ncbi:HbrB-like-domain-containing protein [Xylariales sp. AK1849]|nr:HbrB-like-domain-containing protein [Xylariales sp. AK1849]
MQSGRPLQRAPGSFSPLPGNVNVSSAAAAAAVASGSPPPQPYSQSQYPARPQIRRIDTSSSDDTTLSISKTRSPQSPVGITSPSYASFTTQPNSSTNSLQNFSRPGRSGNEASSIRTASPLTLPPTRGPGGGGYHSRKHSQTQGQFDSTLPSTSTSSLSQVSMPQEPRSPSGTLSASQIAAQAAMQHQQHNRHRSQTVPFPGSEGLENPKRPGTRPVQSHGQDQTRGPLVSPPMLSLTEASVPREGPFGGRRDSSNSVQGYHNGLLGSQAATTAANVVFPRTSPQTSPGLPTQEQLQLQLQHSPFLPPLSIPDKPARSEKSKVKLFSRPKKIDTKGESKERPLPSPGKIGSALASLQRGNFSTASLVDSQSMYNLANSSSATIRPIETPIEREGKEKEKKHHFLSRQKHKLSSKDDYHLPLSSAASNSRPVDPNAPSSLYNFNIPPSPGPTSASFSKSVSGLDLRHGGRALREKRKEDKLGMAHDNESVFTLNSNLNNTSEWPGPPSLGMASSLSQTQSNLTFFDPVDGSKYGLHNMTLDDAWPYLKAKLLVIFEGEDLRLPIEDFNRVVTMHIQYCIQRRSAHIVIEDLRELLSTGFSSLDHTLRTTSEDRLIPALVDVWMVTFTSILPYMQAVFLPLDLEFSGTGPLLTPEQARDFWGGVVSGSPAPGMYNNGYTFYGSHNGSERELGAVLDVRRLVLLAFRDALILPRYEKLKTIFSRLSLEHLPSSLASLALSSPPIISGDYASVTMSSPPRDTDMTTNSGARPGTAMSLDPSIASYNSNSSTLLGDSGSNPSRSRAISNVSFGSGASDPNTTASLLRPFAPTTRARADSDREQRDQNAESGSKQVTDMVGRMLQCMSVLASVSTTQDEGAKMVSELGRLLKLNWLGRGRTGRNRRGMVGGRVRREHSDRIRQRSQTSTQR